MPWQRRLFKGNKVFARTDALGNLLDTDGRVEIRYKLTDPRAYQAAAINLKKLGGAEGGALLPDADAVPGVEPARTTRAVVGASGGDGAGDGAHGTGTNDVRTGGLEADGGGSDDGGSNDGGSKGNGLARGTASGEQTSSGSRPAASSASGAAAYGRPTPASAPGRPGASRASMGGGTSTTRMVKSGGHSPSPPYFDDREPVVIYTDGACSGNPGPAGIGVVLTCGTQRKELSEYLGQGTSNIAELTAIKRALEQVKDARRTVLLYLDSQYSLGVLNGWKVKANQGLVDSIKREMERFEDLRFIKVPGHAGIPENERCDQLAREAVSRGR